jgi:hypothetical protein
MWVDDHLSMTIIAGAGAMVGGGLGLLKRSRFRMFAIAFWASFPIVVPFVVAVSNMLLTLKYGIPFVGVWIIGAAMIVGPLWALLTIVPFLLVRWFREPVSWKR